MTDQIVVLTTCGAADEAARLARGLVEARLAACVNVLPGATSHYRWQDKIEESAEWLLLAKTSRAHFDGVRAWIERHHSYELPEVIALPILDGAPNYLNWLRGETLDR